MSGCTRGCGKKKKRETRRVTKGRRGSADKSIETEYISGLDEPSDTPTESTEYQTLAERSTPSERSKSRRRDREPERRASPEPPRRSPRRRDDDEAPESTPRRKKGDSRRKKKSPRKPKAPPDDDDDSSDGTASTRRPEKSKRRRSVSSASETDTGTTESSLTCATVNLSKFLGESSESETSGEELGPAACEDAECGAGTRPRAKVKRRKPPSESSDSWTETSTASSEGCPSLCRTDPSKLPRRPTKCDSSCRRQAWLERQRDKRQAEMDDYLLRKGFRYFDDMCKCSLKCLMSQICVDPFARSIAFSTVGFFLGVKLCWELDGYYIPF